mgnify:FL=1
MSEHHEIHQMDDGSVFQGRLEYGKKQGYGIWKQAEGACYAGGGEKND